MKSSIFLLLLMMAPGLGAESGVFSIQTAAVGAPRDTRPGYEYGAEHQITRWRKTPHENEKTLLSAGPINQAEAKQLKLIFLLMLS